MNWSWKLGRFAGIDVFVHWTFLLLLAWITYAHYGQGDNIAATVEGVGFVLAIFGCVLLHEYGHALAARQYGIATRDITLLPIGGVARLEKMPDKPLEELWVAVAGPLVNVAIAVIILLVFAIIGAPKVEWTNVGGHAEVVVRDNAFLVKLLMANISLVVFNAIPAFPMDGGRVLRAVLALRLDYLRATHIAAAVGQMLAILFFFGGFLSGNIFLMFIGAFVYLGAQGEASAAEMKSAFRGIPVGAAMITRFSTLATSDTLGRAIDELLAGDQKDFPVVAEGRLVGLLTRDRLLKALAEGGRELRVGDAMKAECPVVERRHMLEGTFQHMRENNCSSVPVLDGGRLVGMLDLENIGEFMMIQSALQSWRHRSDVDNIFQPNS